MKAFVKLSLSFFITLTVILFDGCVKRAQEPQVKPKEDFKKIVMNWYETYKRSRASDSDKAKVSQLVNDLDFASRAEILTNKKAKLYVIQI